MKTKLFATIAVVALLVAGGFSIAQEPGQPAPARPDPRIKMMMDQNEQILKNQEDIKASLAEIKGALADLKESVLILKRRSS